MFACGIESNNRINPSKGQGEPAESQSSRVESPMSPTPDPSGGTPAAPANATGKCPGAGAGAGAGAASADRRAIMSKMKKAKGRQWPPSMRSLSMRSVRSTASGLLASSRSLRFKQSAATADNDTTTSISRPTCSDSPDGGNARAMGKATTQTAKASAAAGLLRRHRSLRSLRSLFSASTSTAGMSTRSSLGGDHDGDADGDADGHAGGE